MEEYYRGESRKFKKIRPTLTREEIGRVDLITEKQYYMKNIKELMDILHISLNYDYNEQEYSKALGKLQHYGIRTRLIDVTASKNIALYFASCDDFMDKGYIYIIKKENGFIPIQNEWAFSVKRKINLIFEGDNLIKNEIDLGEYFLKKDKLNNDYIKKWTLTDPVILDYEKVFSDKDIINIRYKKQNAGFILLGNNVDKKKGKLLLRDEINYQALDNLTYETIESDHKLTALFDLSQELPAINHVNLFPDDTKSIELMKMYQDIYLLTQDDAKRRVLFKKYLFKEFSIIESNIRKSDRFIQHLSLNLNALYQELINENLFYFVFYELASYYQYFRAEEEAEPSMVPAILTVNKICRAA